MKLSDFDYKLPKELIATEPTKPRDHSRLLLLDKLSGEIRHQYFHDLLDYLQRGDVLVLNNSKVFPARLIGHKETGGQVEVFLHQRVNSSSLLLEEVARLKGELWNCILGGRVKEDLEIKFDNNLECKILKNNNDGTWEVEFNKTGNDFMKLVEKIGKVPIPPYIEKQRNPQRYLKPNRVSDTQDYQTVYADNNKVGSVAAPTAGFHFTPRLLKKIKNKGVQIEYVTLHVGLGTFAPVKVDNIKKHKMHAEFVEINKEVAQKIFKAKKEKRRIIAVGTTSLRTLEGVLSLEIKKPINQLTTYQLPINIFIYPGYKFKIVDAMITNFHLPKSTLLMLVSALAGQDKIKKAYQEAIDKKYRFYSYGDAMFIY
ncbi:MAG: tRNA preQ1(34) S-adenosylmethionine ribosyltransferase-isomerase QueA [Lutibacter sp.]|nr:tRNA preQ1(34) S-adenosylmethionine ribosyltransferase-isomerase QueA [Lutibacter sp.]